MRFIKWWWNRNDDFSRTIAYVVSFFVIAVCLIPVFGKDVMLIVLFGTGSAMLFWACRGLIGLAKDQWKTYKNECPSDDVKIINRLKESGPGSAVASCDEG